MKYFYVNRATWKRGPEGDSYLLDNAEQKCCLGFIGLQCGIPPKYLLMIQAPATVNYYNGIYSNLLTTFKNKVNENSHLAVIAMNYNDKEMSESEREAQLSFLFREHGCDIVFYTNFSEHWTRHTDPCPKCDERPIKGKCWTCERGFCQDCLDRHHCL